MTEFKACFSSYDDDLPFPTFEDCGGEMDEDEEDGG